MCGVDRPAWPAERAAEGRGQLVGGHGDGVRRYLPVVELVIVIVVVELLLVVLVLELVVFELLVFVELLLQLVLRQLKALHFLNFG